MYDVDVFYTFEKWSTAAAKREKPIRPVMRLVAIVYFIVVCWADGFQPGISTDALRSQFLHRPHFSWHMPLVRGTM